MSQEASVENSAVAIPPTDQQEIQEIYEKIRNHRANSLDRTERPEPCRPRFIRSSCDCQSASKSSIYWTVANGFDTMYSFWNPADQPQDVLLKLSYAGGNTYNHAMHIEPKGSAMADVKHLAEMGTPDAKGNILPLSVKEGSLVLTAASGNETDPINVVMSGGIYNPVTATCGNVCNTCNGCGTFPPLNPNPYNGPVNAYGWFYAQCPWSNGSIQNLGNYARNWRTNQPGVLTVQSTSNLVLGTHAGFATVSTDLFFAPVNAGQICTQGNLPPCPTGNPTQTGFANIARINHVFVISDTGGACGNCTPTMIQRQIVYQPMDLQNQPVRSFLTCEAGSLTSINTPPTTTGWNCLVPPSPTPLNFTSCASPQIENIGGVLRDTWGMSYGQPFAPVGCGYKTKQWWVQALNDQTPAAYLAFVYLNGSVRSNLITIDSNSASLQGLYIDVLGQPSVNPPVPQ